MLPLSMLIAMNANSPGQPFPPKEKPINQKPSRPAIKPAIPKTNTSAAMKYVSSDWPLVDRKCSHFASGCETT